MFGVNYVTYHEVTGICRILLASISITVRVDGVSIPKAQCVHVSCCNTVGQVAEALDMSPHRFKALYGVDKPEDDGKIIFSCLMGGRSFHAIQIAEALGYTK